ncbi:hypothetical protein MmiAt1_15080 [Methanimicrococcus sp. At1]|uniref:DUF373 family protein n=1 Tax=Methanimicrococcus hacksteinii TaxID=3028293 RepID=A0ABU3VR84_9EURY|nr:DUF373 family protein [Methanimicrococcus sp. At1]MDV0445907.1 hypothetical protein [Methanimicrococcus sp. At1]
MDTLVICIDRDNDLGEKAKVITPVVGRGANIAAAVSLATVDPEDSDTNTIFGGIRILDELRSLGVDAEIVSFAGDKNVGTISDKKIADQLDDFLEKQDVKSAIFVSDGVEDESLIPLVQSRVKVDSVQRIIVMQSENLESTYYMIKNFLKDPKFLQTFFVPIGLALIIYALAMATSNPQWAIIGTFLVVGGYMILRAYSLNDRFLLSWRELKKSFHAHQLSFVTTIAAILLLIIGTIIGAVSVWNISNFSEVSYYGFLPLVSLFIKKAVLWYAGAIFVYLLGKIFDRIYAKEDYQGLIVEMLFTLSGTLLFWSAGSYALSVTMPETGYSFPVVYFIYSIVLAVLIALVGIYFSATQNNNSEASEDENEETSKSSKKKEKPKTEKTITVKDETDFDEEETEDDDKEDEEIPSDPVKIKIGIRDKND